MAGLVPAIHALLIFSQTSAIDTPPSPRVVAGLDPAIHDEAQQMTAVWL
jgi:hypothetical protein